MTTMKNLIAFYDSSNQFKTQLEDVPILTAGDLQPHEVLIKVAFAGSNPKDVKHPLPSYFNNKLNQGDDCAGTITAVGSRVRNFRAGDRVAGFHYMDEPHGTYAEYAICPAQTVFHVPDSVTYEEAATIPLAAFTAAVGLYRNLQLPAPWDRSDEHTAGEQSIPLIVNAASTAVGSFAIKLARMNPRIKPIIAIAGASGDFVHKELGVDMVLDYRSSSIAEELQKALGGLAVNHAFDAVNSLKSVKYLTAVLKPGTGRYTCTTPITGDAEKLLQENGLWYERIYVGDVLGSKLVKLESGVFGQEADTEKATGIWFGSLMSRVFELGLEEGTFSGHPHELVKGGLEGVEAALRKLAEGDRGNAKFVTRIADTRGVAN